MTFVDTKLCKYPLWLGPKRKFKMVLWGKERTSNFGLKSAKAQNQGIEKITVKSSFIIELRVHFKYRR